MIKEELLAKIEKGDLFDKSTIKEIMEYPDKDEMIIVLIRTIGNLRTTFYDQIEEITKRVSKLESKQNEINTAVKTQRDMIENDREMKENDGERKTVEGTV